MLSEAKFFEIAYRICDGSELGMQSVFSDLGIDSTKLIELLIEYEIELNVDVLDDRLNLDEMNNFQDVYDYLAHLTGV